MIWNFLKSIFWCGVFHKPHLCMDLSRPDIPPTEADTGQLCVCYVCGTTYEVM